VTQSHTIATTIHGRYLSEPAPEGAPHVRIVGFHGYSENAAAQMSRMQALASAVGGCGVVSIQGLHRFYRSQSQDIAASWMTREDRELAIADNVRYVDMVLDAVDAEWGEPSALVLCGFSQGASMAYRAAALCRRAAAGVLVVGGDVPPELTEAALARVPRALIGWGARDRFYAEAAKDADVERLRTAGTDVSVATLDAAHAWTDAFTVAAGAWLRLRA